MFRHAASLRVIPASIVTNTAQIARRVANLINPLANLINHLHSKSIDWFLYEGNTGT